jgi:cytoskeletal protein CcmA (bactofilin family)
MEMSRPAESTRAEVAHIGKSVVVRGELSGSEDLYLDGEVEGSIELREHHLTIGPHGKVRASVNARDVVVHGELNGNVHGTERVELKKSAVLTGDIVTQRIVIEDGAVFKGSIDTQRAAKPEPKRETVEAVAASGASGGFTGTPAGPAAAKETLVEQKK